MFLIILMATQFKIIDLVSILDFLGILLLLGRAFQRRINNFIQNYCSGLILLIIIKQILGSTVNYIRIQQIFAERNLTLFNYQYWSETYNEISSPLVFEDEC